jgi:hypothetical protein
MSENKSTIFTALVKAQGEMTNPKKNADNPFFKSKYADLTECWKACASALQNNGLAVIQTVEEDRLVTRLIHESGQELKDGGIPLLGYANAKNPSQAMGASISYARRYGLCSLLGLSPDKEDDDGNSLVADTKKQVKISDQQVAQLKKLAIEVKDWERFMADHVSSFVGRKIDDFNELSCEEYDKLKAKFQTRKSKIENAQKENEVKEGKIARGET